VVRVGLFRIERLSVGLFERLSVGLFKRVSLLIFERIDLLIVLGNAVGNAEFFNSFKENYLYILIYINIKNYHFINY